MVGALTAVLTAYYMGRAYLLVFRGEQRWIEARGSGNERYDPHDPSWVMSLPLVVLGALSALGGLIDLPFHPSLVFLDRWLSPVFDGRLLAHRWTIGGEWAFALIDAGIAVLGVGLAVALWGHTSDRPAAEPTVLRRAWYIDWAYDRFIARPSTEAAVETSNVVESEIIDGAVNGFAGLVRASSRQLRKVQTGYVRNYALGLAAGLVLILAYVLTRAS